MANPRFELLHHDVTYPLYVEVEQLFNLACPASPIHYQRYQVQSTKTSVIGAGHQYAGLNKASRRSHSSDFHI